MYLVDCIECNKSFSSELARGDDPTCPHCNKKAFPSMCQICESRAKTSDLARGRFHTACVVRLQMNRAEFDTFYCALCRRSLTNGTSYESGCPQCHHPVAIRHCKLCAEPISTDSGVTVSETYNTEGWPGEGYENVAFHTSCAAFFAQRLEKYRAARGTCRVCGKPLKGSDSFWGRNQHKRCDRFNYHESEESRRYAELRERNRKHYLNSFVARAR